MFRVCVCGRFFLNFCLFFSCCEEEYACIQVVLVRLYSCIARVREKRREKKKRDINVSTFSFLLFSSLRPSSPSSLITYCLPLFPFSSVYPLKPHNFT
ncbi:hypothetical protein DM02DRAFT_397402 [Periconia macrospinosa]|uniref:Secreted protein n=1 Tax=Periconia macrospinosa TaxID=97972 RepID=A0A2V1D063_9PLEO|nr:hypothetical protein DM02DRAFT_397402 [Periconia macrospinosa]